jgi:hypothetical protein
MKRLKKIIEECFEYEVSKILVKEEEIIRLLKEEIQFYRSMLEKK